MLLNSKQRLGTVRKWLIAMGTVLLLVGWINAVLKLS